MELAEKLTKEIYEKFPKVWNLLKERYHDKYVNEEESILKIYFGFYDIIICGVDFNNSEKLPFSMLYGLLEDFFLNNCIPSISLFYYVYNDIKDVIFNSAQYKKSKYQAILKACEILEKEYLR